MSIPSTERMTAIADKGAQPTSVEVNWALRQLVEDAANRLDLSEKSTNSVLTLFGRFERACFRQWLAWLDLPDTRHQLTDVVRIVEAMEHDLLRNPPREEVAAVIPMRDTIALYRVACGWLGREPRVTELGAEEKSAALCGQHFGSEHHPNRYVCELPDGHENLHAAPSVPIRQHAEPVRMEMLGAGLMAEIGPVVIGEEIARQLNAGTEPATGKGAIRIDDLPEPTREECEADAKLHEEIVEKMARLDPDEVRRQVENWDAQSALYDSTILVEVAREWLEEHRQDVRRQVEILNEVATWAERFCTSGRYEPQMMPQRGLYRALLRLQAVRTGRAVPDPYPEPDGEGYPIGDLDPWQRVALRLGEDLGGSRGGPVGYYSMSPEEWLKWALGCLRDRAPDVDVLATTMEQLRACQQSSANLLHFARYPEKEEAFEAPMSSPDWLVRDIIRGLRQQIEALEAYNGQLARLSEYVASQPAGRFPGAAGRDTVDVVIDALRASGEQREGVLLEAKPAQDPETTRIVIAASLLGHLMGRLHHPTSAAFDLRRQESRAALAWADSLIEESKRGGR